jgi:hypothetical protein
MELEGEIVLQSVGNGRRKKAGSPRCCAFGCYEDRGVGESWCWKHQGEEAV